MRAYSCSGKDLKGNNVKYNIDNDCSCFVENNEYEVIEIPKLSNKSPIEGQFLVFARNASFNYYLLLKLKYHINYNKIVTNQKVHDNVDFYCIGKYSILNDYITIIKEIDGKYVDYGGNLRLNYKFDYRDVRKLAYNTSSVKIQNRFLGVKENQYQKFISEGPTKIKHKRNNKFRG